MIPGDDMQSIDDRSSTGTDLQRSKRTVSAVQRKATTVAVLMVSLLALSCADDQNLTPEILSPPVVMRTTVRVLSPRSAEVTGLIKANDRAAIWLVEYGRDLSYGQRSGNYTLPPDTTARIVTDTIRNLTPGAYFHFRLLASSPAGSSMGPDTAVTMPPDTLVVPVAPEIVQTSARASSPYTLVVTGLVRANKRDAVCYVEYGAGQTFDRRSENISLPADTTARTVNISITGLTPGGPVAFRLVVSSAGGTATGPTGTLTMPTLADLVEFSIPLAVGTEWTYNHTYRWHAKDNEFKDITGIHTWRLLSADTTSMPRTYGFVAHKVDSVWHRTRNGQTGGYIDTSYYVVEDIPFTAKVSVDSITIQWPATIAQGTIPVDRILRFVDKGTTTIRLKGIFGGAINYDALYEQGKGLVSYASSISVMSGAYTLTFTLTSLVKP
jgi:hypothetical protein